MLSPEHVAYIAPRARPDYVAVLTSQWAWDTMAHYKINSNYKRLSGFLANIMVETGGLTIFQESLNYSSPARLRHVWPARFKNKSDAELASLCNNEVALANATYAGRMGNRPGTNDAFDYRGTGWLQCTGRTDAIKYYKMAGIDVSDEPSKMADMNASFLVACAEWSAYGCNEIMDNDRFGDTCVKINAGPGALKRVLDGKITHRQACQSLPDRQAQYKHIAGMFQVVTKEEVFAGDDETDQSQYDEDDSEEVPAI